MSVLTLVLLSVLVTTGYILMSNNYSDSRLSVLKSLGLFAFVFGLLGQFIGMYGALQSIAAMQVEISPALLAGGIKVSSISSIYGMIIFVISYLIWFGINAFKSTKSE